MLNTDMREYFIPIYTSYTDGYGQTHYEEDLSNPAARFLMAVYPTNYETQQNFGWNAASFIGMTQKLDYGPVLNNAITGEMVMKKLSIGDRLRGPSPLKDWDAAKFEVIAILSLGRYYQVFLREVIE